MIIFFSYYEKNKKVEDKKRKTSKKREYINRGSNKSIEFCIHFFLKMNGL